MKTLIVYASKYGCTEDCVNYLKSKLSGEVEICSIQKAGKLKLRNYDVIIIGSSIYVGAIQKDMKKFCEKNTDILLTKKIGLFLCCATPNKVNEYFEENFPPELLKKAVVKKNFGGEIRTEKMGIFSNLIIRLISKGTEIKAEILYKCIDSFAETMNY